MRARPSGWQQLGAFAFVAALVAMAIDCLTWPWRWALLAALALVTFLAVLLPP